jgi:hypothetical protein
VSPEFQPQSCQKTNNEIISCSLISVTLAVFKWHFSADDIPNPNPDLLSKSRSAFQIQICFPNPDLLSKSRSAEENVPNSQSDCSFPQRPEVLAKSIT